MNKNWETRILHLGLGRFHRGHQAVYYQRLAETGDARWGTISLSMRSTEARDLLRAAEMKYPVVELGEKNLGVIWVESIREALDAQEDFNQVMNSFELSEIEIVSLTVTEKGYCLHANGELNLSHPAIKKDLSNPEHPQSTIGLLALGLKRRSEKLLPGLTVLSCDNLRENGSKLQNAISVYLQNVKWNEVIEWMNNSVTFPNSMVDRIVPALSDEKLLDFEQRFALRENSHLIATEEFCQWVIEDKFFKQRPPLDLVGVQFVKDVRPFEEIKLRMLNASHSFLAYAGMLRGYKYVHEAIADISLLQKVELLMLKEVVPLIKIPPGFDIVSFEEILINRFRNNQLPHQLKQIAMDGSQKLPQRILPSLIEAHLQNSGKEVLLATVCAWLNYCWKVLDYDPNELDDPLRETFNQIEMTERFYWFVQMLETAPFESLKNRDELKKLIVQKSSTYSLLI